MLNDTHAFGSVPMFPLPVQERCFRIETATSIHVTRFQIRHGREPCQCYRWCRAPHLAPFGRWPAGDVARRCRGVEAWRMTVYAVHPQISPAKATSLSAPRYRVPHCPAAQLFDWQEAGRIVADIIASARLKAFERVTQP